MLTLIKIVLLAIVQGLAELLPISSSAHVIVLEKLMGLDPSTPVLTLLLVALHTGTMFAVIVYFWKRWRAEYFRSTAVLKQALFQIVLATAITGAVGQGLVKLIEKYGFPNAPHAEVEQLFSHLELIAPALALAGLMILAAGMWKRRSSDRDQSRTPIRSGQACWIGAVQGFCLPFRGFSRSGATISTGMLLAAPKKQAEDFSFALAVALTPPVIVREVLRLMKATEGHGSAMLQQGILPSLMGAVFAFMAGLAALHWLSNWLESGRWWVFGVYCLVAAAVVAALKMAGY